MSSVAAGRRRDQRAGINDAEETGLYEETATIGFKLNWEKLLQLKGLVIIGHSLRAAAAALGAEPAHLNSDSAAHASPVVVERHRTAMTRYELSKPVKSLLEYRSFTGA